MIRPPTSRKNNIFQRLENKRGFTLFEFALVAAIFALLTTTLVNRVLFYREQAEIAAAQQLVGTLRTALQMKATQLLIANQESELLNIINENPIDWLSSPPGNYLGEYFSPNVNELLEGNWYYQRSDRTLIYLLNNGKSFAGGTLILLKFKVRLLRLPSDSAKPSAAPGPVRGVVLDQVLEQADVANVERR